MHVKNSDIACDIFYRFLLALPAVGVPVWLIMGVGWSWHLLWLFLIGPLSFLFLRIVAKMVLDLLGGSVSLVGTARKWVGYDSGGVASYYCLEVKGRIFEIRQADIYNWVSEGEEVVVKFWPRTEILGEVKRLFATRDYPDGFIDRFD